MSGWKQGRVRALALVALAAMAVSACGSPGAKGGGPSGQAGGSPTAAVLDTAKAVTRRISAAKGGAIGFKTDDAAVRITFPNGALAKDTDIVVTPLSQSPGQDENTLQKGFDVKVKGTDAGPVLSVPAYVEMVVAKELPDGTSLVDYKADGTFEVLPTKVKAGKGVTAILGLASHFSPITTRNVGKKAADKARDKFSDYDWVVYVNDTANATYGGLAQSIKLTLRAVNAGGDIAGQYKGSASIKSSNKGSIGPGTLDSPQSGGAGSVQIVLIAGDPLASLTPNDPLSSLTPEPPDPLAPLTDGDMPTWIGSGKIVMSSMGVGGHATGRIGGYSGTGGTGNTSSLPVQLAVTGTQVSLTVSGFPGGAMTFRGFVRGEGKK